MIRILLLVFPCAIVFAGFAMPFFVEGVTGLIGAIFMVLTGSILLWIIEIRTRASPDKNSLLNKILNTDAWAASGDPRDPALLIWKPTAQCYRVYSTATMPDR